ncbi:hypothetical protein JZ751_001474 [Albula glossodonta]|uniref:RNA/RNP complex-1-interacting phosphatase n=1 Tax=Albula glossodonta TaxID=121402 RepID=A0A8T2PTW6_9TELE|nr:hypothetical protein JZ751_001474 [Albula glossodonta]
MFPLVKYGSLFFVTTQRVLPTGQFCIVSLRTLNYEVPLSLCVLPSLIRFKELTLVGVWRARTAAASDVNKRNLSTSNIRVSGEMSTKNKKKKIPDRWKDYQAMGKRISGTRFIAFKVPLKESLMKGLPPSEAFGLFDLIRLVEEENEELGLIIDLTFTTRYYTPMDLPDSVNYLKIFTTGHQVPSDSTILSFKKAVNRFLQENEKNDKLIGVHCTHGLNRTGYLVCRYLIDVEGMVPSEAVALFNRSRGHCIERQNYLHDLLFGKKRSNIGMDNPCQDPIRGNACCSKDDNPFCKSSPSNKQVPSQEATHCATHSRPLPHYVMRPSSPFRHEQNQGWPQFPRPPQHPVVLPCYTGPEYNPACNEHFPPCSQGFQEEPQVTPRKSRKKKANKPQP